MATPGSAVPDAALLSRHGGGYVTGSAFGYRHLGAALAAATELTTVLPEYRLAPEHPFPAGLDDALRTYALRTYAWLIDGCRRCSSRRAPATRSSASPRPLPTAPASTA